MDKYPKGVIQHHINQANLGLGDLNMPTHALAHAQLAIAMLKFNEYVDNEVVLTLAEKKMLGGSIER